MGFSNKLKIIISKINIYYIYFLAFFLSFNFNLFKLIPSDFFYGFQLDSEELVINRISQSLDTGLLSYSGLLLRLLENGNVDIYLGQIGFQGFVFGLLNSVLFDTANVIFFQSIVAFTTALVITLILIQVDKLSQRKTSTYIFATILFASPYLSSMARNLYWIPSSMFLPLLIMLLYTNRNPNQSFTFKELIVLFLAFAFRFSMGFEFTSTIIIAAAVPLLFSLHFNNYDFLLLFKKTIQYSFVSISSFMLVLSTHIIQKAIYFNSLRLSLEQQFYNIAKRIPSINFNGNIEDVYIDSLEINPIFVVFRYLMNPVLILVITMIFISIYFVYMYTKSRISIKSIEFVSLSAAWLAFLAPLSWYVIASGHSHNHYHINYVIWNLPFVFFSILSIHVFSFRILKKNNRFMKTIIITAIIGSLALSILFNILIHGSRSNRLFMANIYHHIILSIQSEISYEVIVNEKYFINNNFYLEILPSVRYESLIIQNNGQVILGKVISICDWSTESSGITLICPYNENIDSIDTIVIQSKRENRDD